MSSYDYTEPVKSYFPSPSLEGDDLHRAKGCAPHVVTFWSAVCAFIDQRRDGVHPDHEIEYPSWGQWRSVWQCMLAGRRNEAIKLLRASTCVWEKKPLPAPAFVTSTAWKEFMMGNGTRQWEHHGGLTLSEAKSIVDTMGAHPYWFGRDPGREFSPRVAEHEEPVAGGHAPEETKSLGGLLREKISAMKAEEGPVEHSLWLNIYPGEPGYCRAVANGSRAEADQYAAGNRIACTNIKFKEGEGL